MESNNNSSLPQSRFKLQVRQDKALIEDIQPIMEVEVILLLTIKIKRVEKRAITRYLDHKI
jgi:hypothetical protein